MSLSDDSANEAEEEAVDVEELEGERKLVDNPLGSDLLQQGLCLLFQIGRGLSHVYVRLDICERYVTDIGILKSYVHLRFLDISENFITDISSLNYMKDLITLNANRNRLTSVALDPHPYLQIASFAYNLITATEGLEHPFLEQLNLNCNQITEVSGLRPGILTNLHTLELRGNKLETTAGLYLPNLAKLFLADNAIKIIEGIDRMEKLTILHLRDNQISDLSGFSDQMKSLRYINFRSNNIATFDDLKKIVCLPNLQGIVLDDNPCQDNESYRVEVLIQLRRLLKLDKNEYSAMERTEAEQVHEHKRQEKLLMEQAAAAAAAAAAAPKEEENNNNEEEEEEDGDDDEDDQDSNYSVNDSATIL